MLTWAPRRTPLRPAAVLAQGEVVGALASSTATRLRASHELLTYGGEGYLLVVGSHDALPWVDGVRYLGWDGGLLISTTQEVSPHPNLLLHALRQRFGTARERFAVLPGVLLAVAPAAGVTDPRVLDEIAARCES